MRASQEIKSPTTKIFINTLHWYDWNQKNTGETGTRKNNHVVVVQIITTIIIRSKLGH